MASNKPFDVFLSYNQASAQPAVKDLYQKLKDTHAGLGKLPIDFMLPHRWLLYVQRLQEGVDIRDGCAQGTVRYPDARPLQ